MWIMCKTRLLLPFLPGGNKYSVYAEYSLINGYSAVKRRFFDALCKSCRRSKLHIACFAALRADFVPISFTYAKWHLPRVRRIFSAPSRRGRYCYHFFYKIATQQSGCNFAKEMGVFPRTVSAEKACRTRDKNTAWRRKTVSRGRTYRDCPRSFLRCRISRP